MVYGFGGSHAPKALDDLNQDLANFLLIRGPYAWLGTGWAGCDQQPIARPAVLDSDFGTPLGLCSETSPGSGVFERNYTKAIIRMDCEVWKGTIVPVTSLEDAAIL